MAGFEVEPDRLSATGAALQGVADRLARELTGFQAELAGFGSPWGGDDIGSLIGAAHSEVASYAFECYLDSLEEITKAGVEVSGMGERYRQVEENVHGHFQRIGRRWER